MGFDAALVEEAEYGAGKQSHPPKIPGTAAVPFPRAVGDGAYVKETVTCFARFSPLLFEILGAQMYEKEMERELAYRYEPVEGRKGVMKSSSSSFHARCGDRPGDA